MEAGVVAAGEADGAGGEGDDDADAAQLLHAGADVLVGPRLEKLAALAPLQPSTAQDCPLFSAALSA